MDDVIKEILDTYWKKLSKLPNVVGYSGALKHRRKDGKILPDTEVFTVYVSDKKDKTELKPSEVIPRTFTLKSSGKVVETDVVLIGHIRAPLNAVTPAYKQSRHRPVEAGCSVGHPQVTAGTLGYFCRKLEDPVFFNVGASGDTVVIGDVYILSNNHVLAAENKANLDDVIFSPGTYDGGSFSDTIAELSDFVEIKFTEFQCPYRNLFRRLYDLVVKRDLDNEVDCALARVLTRSDVKVELLGIGRVTGKSVAKIGDKVKKSGRTTCLTENGVVTDTDLVVNVAYGRGAARFINQILIEGEGFSAGGDSGSLVVNDQNEAVGLLFAGSDEAGTTIASPIDVVLQKLGADLL